MTITQSNIAPPKAGVNCTGKTNQTTARPPTTQPTLPGTQPQPPQPPTVPPNTTPPNAVVPNNPEPAVPETPAPDLPAPPQPGGTQGNLALGAAAFFEASSVSVSQTKVSVTYGKINDQARELAKNLGVPVAGLKTRLEEISASFTYSVGKSVFGALGIDLDRYNFYLLQMLGLDPDKIKDMLSMQRGNPQASCPTNTASNPARIQQIFANQGRSPDATIEVTRASESTVSQQISFAAKGVVTTSDGKTIDIDVTLNMSSYAFQRTVERASVSIWSDEGQAEMRKRMRDPLVIAFDAPAAALTQRKFTFDLDADGTLDQISTLAKGCGFLAFDRNGDGVVNDGGELFGALSGDGFAELATYDQDSNGWIDEADEIFSKLRIWTTDEQGNSSLFALGEVGIGAIYLGSAKGDYFLGNLFNPDGAIRSTGIFLRENGTAGIVQHLDLVV